MPHSLLRRVIAYLILALCSCPPVFADEQRPKSIIEAPEAQALPNSERAESPPSEVMGDAPSEAQADTEEASTAPSDIAVSLLGHEIQRGEFQRLYWTAGQAVAGLATPTPVLIAAGRYPGPTLCLTAAVHGDEVNGVETIRRIMFNLDKEALRGTVIGVPVVNMHGFIRASRYLPDRRDLNRYFPGDPKGSAASRIAFSFFNDVISRCDRLIDIHTGSFHRTNLTQLRGDLSKPAVEEFSKMFDDIMVLHGAGAPGTLRRAAVEAGIPSTTLEAGEPLRLQLREVEHSVRGVRAVMHHLKMIDEEPGSNGKQTVIFKSVWLRSNQTGVFLSQVKLGQKVKPGDTLGTVTDPITNLSSKIHSTVNGQVIGMALNQMVMPGFAAFHIGILEASKPAATESPAPALAAGEVATATANPDTSLSETAAAKPATAQPADNAKAEVSTDQDEHPE